MALHMGSVILRHHLKIQFNPYMPYDISHLYQFNGPILNLSAVNWVVNFNVIQI